MRKGLIFGVVLLLGVDIVWVGSSAISRVSCSYTVSAQSSWVFCVTVRLFQIENVCFSWLLLFRVLQTYDRVT